MLFTLFRLLGRGGETEELEHVVRGREYCVRQSPSRFQVRIKKSLDMDHLYV